MFNATANNLMSNGLMLADYGREGAEWAGRHGHGHGPIGILIAIVAIIVIIAVFKCIRRGGHGCGHGERKNALDTLAQRYANGEIEKDEYLEKRDVLKSRK